MLLLRSLLKTKEIFLSLKFLTSTQTIQYKKSKTINQIKFKTRYNNLKRVSSKLCNSLFRKKKQLTKMRIPKKEGRKEKERRK